MCETNKNFTSQNVAYAVLVNKNEKHFMFEDKVTIGRSPTAFLCKTDSYISRRHCIIEKTHDNKFTICDMSNAGTFVNNRKLVKNEVKELNHFDRIRLANNDMYTYVFYINRKHLGLKSTQKLKTSSHLAKEINNLNETQFLEKKSMDKEMSHLVSEVTRLKEELHEKLKDRENERLKVEKETECNKEHVEDLKKKLKEMEEEKKRLLNEYQLKISDSAKKEDELKTLKNEMITRHQEEREELENKCKSEMEELKKQLQKSEAKNQEIKEWQNKYEEIKNALLDSEFEQQRLFEARAEVETKVIDLTNHVENKTEQVKELELKMKESEEIIEKVEKEMKGLEEDIMCSVCAEIFIEPTAINCGHVFCKLCITEWSKKKKICPMCRAKLLSTVRIFTMDSIIERNLRLMSKEAQTHRETLIAERKKGKTPQKKKTAKKRKLDNQQSRPNFITEAFLLPSQVPDVTNQQVQPDSEGVDPFNVGWVTNQHMRNVRVPERNSPVTVAAIDLTNVSVFVPTPMQGPSHTITSADVQSTIDLTNL